MLRSLRLLALTVAAACVTPVVAQPAVTSTAASDPSAELYAGGQRRLARVASGAVIQHYDYGAAGSMDAVTVPLYVFVPLGRAWSTSLRAGYATASGTSRTGSDLPALGGVRDVVLSASYQRALGDAHVVTTLGLGLPTGATTLTTEEFETARVLAQDEFRFETPALGQGFRAAPAITVAMPLGDVAVLGLGASYQLRTGFRPFETLSDDYVPAGKVLLTTGLDLRLGTRSAWSLDLTYAIFGDDTVGGRTYAPGNRLFVTMLLSAAVGAGEYYLLGRFRHVADGTDFDGNTFGALSPHYARLENGVRLVFGQAVELGLLAGTRYYGDLGDISKISDAIEGDLGGLGAITQHQLLFDFGVAPTVAFGPSVRLRTAFTYSLGLGELVELDRLMPLSGFRAEAGLEFLFPL